MIYSVDIYAYPTEGQAIEEHAYPDCNGFIWKIARVVNGFFVLYTGDPYFSERSFEVQVLGETIWIRNTNCIFFKDPTFDTYYHVRTVLCNGYTDDIWEIINELFQERMDCDPTLLVSEIIS